MARYKNHIVFIISWLVLLALFLATMAKSSILSDAAGESSSTSTGFDLGTDTTWTICGVHRFTSASPPNWLDFWHMNITGANNDAGLALRQGSGDYTHRFVGSNWGGGAQNVVSSAYTPDTNWHRLCVTRNGTTHTIYRDGTQVGTGGTSITYGSPTTEFIIGPYQDGATGYSSSYISDVYILSDLKDATWIADHDTCRLNTATSGLWGYWKFDTNCSGGVCQDETANDRDMTLTGATYETGTVADSFLTGDSGGDCAGGGGGGSPTFVPWTRP